MTPALREALIWLLDDFKLAECVEIVIDDVNMDDLQPGQLRKDHPRVVRFNHVVKTLEDFTRVEVSAPLAAERATASTD